jgi:DNA-binding CsgD family transcriptional regulator
MSSPSLTQAMEVVGRVAAVASEQAPQAARASAVIEELRKIIPFDAAEINTLHPISGEVTPLANVGYESDVLEHLHSQRFTELMKALALPITGRPVRMKDLPGDPFDNWAVGDVLVPAGYSEGLTMCLRTTDGRVTGVINLSTTSPEHPSDIAKDAISSLCSVLANMADQTQSGKWLSMLIGSGQTAVGISNDGNPIAIPGLPGHDLFQPGSELISYAHKNASMNSWSSFIWPQNLNDDMFRIRVMPCSGENQPMSAVISLDVADVGPLTHRELEVLTLAANGLSNLEIGAALQISSRTVGSHIEHILDKLGAPNRAAAAARAITEGLILGRVKRFD